MSLGKGLLTAGILVCTTVLARAGGPYLINAQQADFRSRPEYVRDHLAHIESLPFDGVVFTSTTTAVLMNGTARSYEEIAQEFAPLHGLSFTRIKHNLAWVNVDRPADFFGDWTVTIENFRILARVLRENGIAGIFFDNEEYLRRLFNYPDNCDDATKSLAQYRAQARLRGREIGEALANEFPEIVLMVLHGPYSSFAGTPEEVHRGQTEWDTEELRGPFSIGLLEGLDSRAEFVDGGAVYAYRAAADFQVSYDYRKFELASDGSDCPFISPELRHVWPRKVGIAFGVYNHSFAGVPMDATIMRTTLAAALQRCDEFVWLYSEGINWNAPGEIAPEWVDAVLAAKGPQAFVSITSPGTGGTFVNPASISIKATASRAGGEISKVEFFDG
ncbi:MAG TPA: Ig-like domain-containing protein, partial [Chthoniobacterales bacterium]